MQTQNLNHTANVTLKNIVKTFGEVEVIKGIDLEINDGEFVVFVGPSGCGKSTLLRLISGLDEVTSGEILIGDKNVTHTQAAKRGVSMVFQSYALYPHMTVYENMQFGLKIAKTPKAEMRKLIADAAEKLQITDLLDRRPGQLSGGQRQRVAIGRSIVKQPLLFLFDEPLSNLDAELRVGMRIEIADLHRELKNTMIYVTHDQIEAMTLADRIVILRDGHIEQVGTPKQVYENPCNQFVAGFIGSPSMNFISAIFKGDDIVEIYGKNLKIGANFTHIKTDELITIGIRPEHLSLGSDFEFCINVEVVATEYLGGTLYIYGVTPHGDKIIVENRQVQTPNIGDEISVGAAVNKLHLFDQNKQSIHLI